MHYCTEVFEWGKCPGSRYCARKTNPQNDYSVASVDRCQKGQLMTRGIERPTSVAVCGVSCSPPLILVAGLQRRDDVRAAASLGRCDGAATTTVAEHSALDV